MVNLDSLRLPTPPRLFLTLVSKLILIYLKKTKTKKLTTRTDNIWKPGLLRGATQTRINVCSYLFYVCVSPREVLVSILRSFLSSPPLVKCLYPTLVVLAFSFSSRHSTSQFRTALPSITSLALSLLGTLTHYPTDSGKRMDFLVVSVVCCQYIDFSRRLSIPTAG